MKQHARWTLTIAALFASAVIATPAAAQSDQHHALLTGYGTAGYSHMLGGEASSNFSSTISAILLYSTGDFLFESELEYELEEVATETELEYAQLDYEGFDHAQIVVGKFLLPFGIFGERLHPTWINKLPVMTPLFGMAHEGVPFNSLFPVLSDVGAMARWSVPVGDAEWSLSASAYVTQGPSLPEEDVANEAAEEPGYIDVPAPQLAWGVSFTDNNKNKMVGGRVGLVKGSSFEGYVSGFHAKYDPDQLFDVWATALSLQWRHNGTQVLAEGTLLAQDFEDDTGAFTTQDRKAWYAEVSHRVGAWEPVVRYGYIADATVDGASVSGNMRTVTAGIDYWFAPMIPLKVALVFPEGLKTRLAVQWAFGF